MTSIDVMSFFFELLAFSGINLSNLIEIDSQIYEISFFSPVVPQAQIQSCNNDTVFSPNDWTLVWCLYDVRSLKCFLVDVLYMRVKTAAHNFLQRLYYGTPPHIHKLHERPLVALFKVAECFSFYSVSHYDHQADLFEPIAINHFNTLDVTLTSRKIRKIVSHFELVTIN